MSNGTARVLTLNCWNISEPLDERIELIRAGIEELQPDLIGLQEIVVRRDGFDQAAMILDGLPYHWVYGAAFSWNDRESLLPHDHPDGDRFGNVAASRWPIARSEVLPLPGEESGERRSLVAVIVEAPRGPLPFAVTHLNWKFHHGWVRERQALAAARFVGRWSEECAQPPILVGDLNAEPDSREIRFLAGLASIDGDSAYFQDAWRVAGDGGPGYTWDNANCFAAFNFEPNRRIDYILVGLPIPADGRGWIESARLAYTAPRGAVFASDHFGVVADIRV